MFDLFNFGGGEQGNRVSTNTERHKLFPGKPNKLKERAVIEDKDGEVPWPTKDAREWAKEGGCTYIGYRQEGNTIIHIYRFQ